MRRAAALGVAVTMLGAVLAGCRTGVTMWDTCDQGGDPFGTDGIWVLVCRDATWQPLMTVEEYLRLRRGEEVERTRPPERPTTPTTVPSTTTTTTTTVPEATLDVVFDGDRNDDVIMTGKCSVELGPGPTRSAQTFVAGRTGEITAVGLVPVRFAAVEDLVVGISAVTDGAPSGPVLGATPWNPSQGPSGRAWEDITLTTPVEVTAGEAYAIVLESGSSCPEVGFWGTQSAYFAFPGGNLWQDYGAGFVPFGFDFDTYFRTWVRS